MPAAAITAATRTRPFHGHSIRTRAHTTRVPQTAAEHALPLHCPKPDDGLPPLRQMNIEVLRERMMPACREQLDALLLRHHHPPVGRDTFEQVHVSNLCTPEDVDCLCAAGIAELVTPEMEKAHPTRCASSCFTVVEAAKGRRRFICAPHTVNDSIRALEDDKTAEIHPAMKHVSNYLDVFKPNKSDPSAERWTGATFDGRMAFWQVGIGVAGRAYQRFRDASGRLVQLTRLQMGHVDSVSVMQLLVAALAGHHEVVQHHFRCKSPVCHVWVDGWRYAGPPDAVQTDIDMSLAVAKAAKFQLKDPIRKPQDQYEFIGGFWNHAKGTVRVADKLKAKMCDTPISPSMRGRDIECLTGQCIYASGLTQIPLADYIPSMQFARKVCHMLNSGRATPSRFFDVPAKVVEDLRKWRAAVTAEVDPLVVRIAPGTVGSLFVDATPTSYGAILVMPSQEVFITGGVFEPLPPGVEPPKINVREAQAVGIGLRAFYRHIATLKAVRLFEDNTGVEHSLNKGNSRNADIAAAVSESLEICKTLKLALLPHRVPTIANPADEPSRGKPVDFDKLRAAFEHEFFLKAIGSTDRLGAARVPLEWTKM